MLRAGGGLAGGGLWEKGRQCRLVAGRAAANRTEPPAFTQAIPPPAIGIR